MALTKCKECGSEVSTKAEACPKCGAKQPKGSGSWGFFKVGLYLFGLLLALQVSISIFKAVLGNNAAPQAEQPKQAATPEQIQSARNAAAQWACREFVASTLKSPSTAKFQNYRSFVVSGTDDGPYFVSGYVDSQNSFGAMLRTNFECTLIKVGDSWSLKDLKSSP